MEPVGVFSLSLLGAFAAVLDGRPLTKFRTSKVQALLIYLAVENKQAHRRDFLMELLWPGLPQSSAQVNLRQTIHRLNEAIPAVGVKGSNAQTVPLLLADWQTVQIHPDAAYELDVTTFTRLLKGKPTPEQLEQAIALYQGDFLADFYLADSNVFEEWAAARREALRRLALDALERLSDYHRQGADYEAAERYVRLQLDLDNLRESAHRQLMGVLAEGGRRRAALSHYETLCQLLEGELGVLPSSTTVELYEQIKDDKLTRWQGDGVIENHLVTSSPPHLVIPHNLPSLVTPFVGRESELRALGQYLADPGTRLITILGPGGIGKTRLALAAAEAQLGDERPPSAFSHGVFFVGLAGLGSAELLVPAIATALDFRFHEGNEPKEQLLNYLRHKEMLVVLDNIEHLLAGVGLVDDILTSAPGVRLLVTSREKLNRQAEQLFPIGGLTLPEEEGDVDGSDAVRLFLQSARRVRPDFELTTEVQPAVLHICRLVEGMPLGIVLAAAWLELLTSQEIVVEMSRDLDFLVTEMGDVPERQRSLRAVFNHSWRLLSEREQAIFRQLSVFRGGCTWEAAEAVTGATLRELQSLAHKSLIHRTVAGRYVVHELLRQFAAEMLEQMPEEETAVRDRHSTYYCGILREHSSNWHSEKQVEAIAAVKKETDNILPALHWAQSQKKWQRMLLAINSWAYYLSWQDRHREAEAFFQMIVEEAGMASVEEIADNPDRFRLEAKALIWLSRFTPIVSSSLQKARLGLALLERLELAGQDTRWDKGLAFLTQGIRLTDSDPAEPQEARRLFIRALVLYQKLEDPWGIAESLGGLGYLNMALGRYDLALKRYRASLEIRKEYGDRLGQIEAQRQLGLVCLILGRLDEAEQFLREALELIQQIGSSPSTVKNVLAYTLLWQGEIAEAQLLLKESLAYSQEYGIVLDEIRACRYIGEVLIHTGHYQQAYELTDRALHISREVSNRHDEGMTYSTLGRLVLVELSYFKAQALFAESARFLREVWPNFVGIALAGQGLTACRLSQITQAHQLFSEALASAVSIRVYLAVVFTLPAVALFLATIGRVVRAVEVWEMMKRHPFVASSQWFEDVVGRELEGVTASLPPEVAEAARDRGRNLDLWETAAVLLAELKAAAE